MEPNFEELFESLKTSPSESFESETLEFKNYSSENSLHNAKELAEEISALANYLGGDIIVGVKDSSDVKYGEWEKQLNGFVEVDLDTTKERLKGKLKPHIDIKLSYLQFESKIYLRINIPKRNDSIISTSSGKTCIRDGKSSRPATPEEIRDLVKTLQFYDWSAEDLNISISDSLETSALNEAFDDYCLRRKISTNDLTIPAFLEALGATRNGTLNKGGLLFLGKADVIKQLLGLYEFRFTWKLKNGLLKINEIWSDCLWNCIKIAKSHFASCNGGLNFEYQGQKFTFNQLDETAFHEAYLNALVHRDYSHSGMVSINFTSEQLIITSPGKFYGGINSDNIVFHEPRHRNKSLAHILMLFQLVDRAGIGVTRIGLSSLKYGRKFPVFLEKNDGIEVSMEAEYLRPGIFVINQANPEFGIVDMFILNSVYGAGYILLSELENRLGKINENPWTAIDKAMTESNLKNYVEYQGNKNGIYIVANDTYKNFFDIKKAMKYTSSSEKYVKLYRFLKEFESGSNEEISNLLGHRHASQTSLFLRKTEFVKKGKTANSKWTLI